MSDPKASNYTESVVPCGECGAKLKDAEIRFLWSDWDWLDHKGHRVFIRPEDEQTYYALARSLEEVSQDA